MVDAGCIGNDARILFRRSCRIDLWLAGREVDIGNVLGTHPSISLAGCLLAAILLPNSGLADHALRIRWALLIASGWFIAGAVTALIADTNKKS